MWTYYIYIFIYRYSCIRIRICICICICICIYIYIWVYMLPLASCLLTFTQKCFKRLRAMIRDALHNGHIFPTELDAFDPTNDEIGPCIHTVNLQFIKPITVLAGDCSWALMLGERLRKPWKSCFP